MARMFPPTIADDHGSRAERTVFRKLKDETPDTWIALHSVGLVNHATKPWAEVDFVLITDEGVLCLEVKGGTLIHRDGDWFQNERRMKQSPFAQAGGGASALYDYLAERVPAVRRSFVGHGVLFPESPFAFDLPEAAPEMIYDDTDLVRPISAYIEHLTNYWKQSLQLRRAHVPDGLDRAARSLIVHQLAPDFELVPSLRARLHEVDEELIRLTEQQKELLRGLEETPRVVVRGGAGTGKTLIACDEAARLAGTGLRTVYLCYGSRLAAYVRPVLEPADVRVTHLHGLMRDLIEEAGLEDRLPAVEPRDLFDVYYPEIALDAVERLDRFGSVDAVVIDEGQDLLKPPWVLLLDALVSGELNNGTWRLFHDPNQDIFSAGPPVELDRLENVATCYRLTRNCRNTREVAMATSILSGVAVSETLGAEGPEVTERWYTDRKSHVKSILNQLRVWLDGGVSPGDITVLAPGGFDDSALARIDPGRLPRQIVDVSHADSADPNKIRFSTVAGYKGLESEAVLLTGFTDLDEPSTLSLLYVGASRARALLGLVLDEDCKQAYKERAREVVERLLGVGA
jgi:Nuclease-related domain